MESKIKVTYWLYKAKKNSSKQIPIYLRVKLNYEYFTKATGLWVKEVDWDKKTTRVK